MVRSRQLQKQHSYSGERQPQIMRVLYAAYFRTEWGRLEWGRL